MLGWNPWAEGVAEHHLGPGGIVAVVLRGVGVDVYEIDVARRDGRDGAAAELALLHGPYGEDGTVQGLFELAGVPYVGSGVVGSAVAMDKVMMKRAFAAANLDVARWLPFREGHDVDALVRNVESQLGYPCFVKPSNLGSSVGVSKARDAGEQRIR